VASRKADAQKVEELFAEITEILQSRVKDDSQASQRARNALHDVEGAQVRAAHALNASREDEDEDEQET
jgi:t-SNARE complex subunit (syntaxin)